MAGSGYDTRLSVADIVGPTVLAQGTAAGTRCSLIRLGGCNLSCRWCDTPFVWDSTRYDLALQLASWPAAEVAAAALSCAPSLVVLTGGEPLLQQRATGWQVLLDSLGAVEVGLETNGTIAPSEATLDGVSWVTVSPKLAHSGDPSWDRVKGEVLVRWGQLALTHRIEFVFVVQDHTDIAAIGQLAGVHGLPHHRIWVSPEGTTPATVINRLHLVAEEAVAAGFNVAPRIVQPFGGAQMTDPPPQVRAAPPPVAPVTPPTGALPGSQDPAPVGARFRRT